MCGGETPYNIHRTRGAYHKVKCAGEYAPLIKQAEETVRELISAYQKVYGEGGPDIYRDYMIEKPGMLFNIQRQAEKLKDY